MEEGGKGGKAIRMIIMRVPRQVGLHTLSCSASSPLSLLPSSSPLLSLTERPRTAQSWKDGGVRHPQARHVKDAQILVYYLRKEGGRGRGKE